MEAVLIENAVDLCNMASIPIVGSAAIRTELKYISDNEKLKNVLGFYSSAVSETVKLSPSIENRVRELVEQGIRRFDATHIALAEAAEVDYLLTVDDKLERAASKLILNLKIINPLNFLPEVVKWAQALM